MASREPVREAIHFLDAVYVAPRNRAPPRAGEPPPDYSATPKPDETRVPVGRPRRGASPPCPRPPAAHVSAFMSPAERAAYDAEVRAYEDEVAAFRARRARSHSPPDSPGPAHVGAFAPHPAAPASPAGDVLVLPPSPQAGPSGDEAPAPAAHEPFVALTRTVSAPESIRPPPSFWSPFGPAPAYETVAGPSHASPRPTDSLAAGPAAASAPASHRAAPPAWADAPGHGQGRQGGRPTHARRGSLGPERYVSAFSAGSQLHRPAQLSTLRLERESFWAGQRPRRVAERHVSAFAVGSPFSGVRS
jgi:hypothetical protein